MVTFQLIFLLTVLGTYCLASNKEGCREVEMNPSVDNLYLENHVFRKLEIKTASACEVNCFMDADCVSYNLRQPRDPEGKYLCELSNSTDKIHPLDVKFEAGAVYKSFRNPCSDNPCSAIHRCQTGFTSKGYRCVCRNRLFGSNCTEAPPSVQVFPDSIETEEGKKVFMTCTIISIPPPHFIKWSRSQQSLPPTRSHVRGVNLTLENVTKQDTGSYVCTAKNIWGTISSSTHLKVHSALKFTVKPPLNVTVKTNEVLTLPCSAASDLKLSWMFDGIESLPPYARIDSSNNLIVSSVNFTHGGDYTCRVTNALNSIQTSVTVYVKYPETCAKVKTDISDISGDYFIDPDGVLGEDPFPVYCNMTDKGSVGVTVISHDSEDRIHVNGSESDGSYRCDIHYNGSSLSQIKGLIEVSNSCQQFIKYECHNAAMRLGRISWWVSRDGEKKKYWGGATDGCACNVTSTCPTQEWPCNCDANDDVWREDSGFLTIKSDLPVTQLRFGDTGRAHEEGYHTLGKLECY